MHAMHGAAAARRLCGSPPPSGLRGRRAGVCHPATHKLYTLKTTIGRTQKPVLHAFTSAALLIFFPHYTGFHCSHGTQTADRAERGGPSTSTAGAGSAAEKKLGKLWCVRGTTNVTFFQFSILSFHNCSFTKTLQWRPATRVLLW